MEILAVPFILTAAYVFYGIVVAIRAIALAVVGRGDEIKTRPTKLARFMHVVGIVSSVIAVGLVVLVVVLFAFSEPGDWQFG